MIGQQLAVLRKRKGLTQAALAEKLGVTDRAVSRMESMGDGMQIGTLRSYLAALGMSRLELGP